MVLAEAQNTTAKTMNRAEVNDTQPEFRGKSGRQVGAENVERLRVYLAELKSSGARLPSRRHQPDKSAIAIACGFNRQTLYNNPEAVALLDEAVTEIGLEGQARVTPDSKALHLQRQVDRRDRRIQQLEENLQTRSAENFALRQEIKELKELLRRYDIFEEAMVTNGRKFRP